MDAEDGRLNDLALIGGSRIFAAYHMAKGVKLYVISESTEDEGRRAPTTVVLPDK